MYQWRKFQFFEDRTSGVQILPEIQGNICCTTAGRGQIVFGMDDGNVHIVDRNRKLKSSFKAHGICVQRISQLKQRNLLITVGEEDGTSPSLQLQSTCIKVWDLDKHSSEGTSTSGPICTRVLRVFSQKFPDSEITSFLVREESAAVVLFAFGLANGTVYVIRGNPVREQLGRLKLVAEQIEQGQSPAKVTGMGLRLEARAMSLFVVTTKSVCVFNIQQQIPQRVQLDSHGCGQNCVTMSDKQDLVLGRPEAVYFYELDGRGPCWVFDGEKQYVGWYRGYLIVVTADPRNVGKNVLNIYDLKNKLIVFSASLGALEDVVLEWGQIIVIVRGEKDGERSVMSLTEKDRASKLEMLFQKNLYLVAINLVQSQDSADGAAVAEVMRKFGDHLYLKQDYEESMAQYIRTIGYLEPSYVIQKFLDAQRIHNLTRYLERLHGKGLATADHTTLLLNCYTKLKDVEKLDEFIKADGEHRFDVETAVRVCRAAGYFEHAMYVAKQAGDHASYLRILLEDLRRYEEALEYISGLPRYQAAATLKQYGKRLVGARPKKTTEVLMKICMLESEPAVELVVEPASLVRVDGDLREIDQIGGSRRESEMSARPTLLPSPMDFVHLFVDRPLWLVQFLERYAEKSTDLDPLVVSEIKSTLLELYLCEGEVRMPVLKRMASADENRAATNHISTSTVIIAKGKETADNGQGLQKDEEEAEEGRGRRQKALRLLQSGWPEEEQQPKYDVDLALVLCQMHNFQEGLLFLYERMNLYKEVMAVYMRTEDYKGLISCCKKLADAGHGGDARLWTDVLAYFGEKERDCEEEVREVLKLVERDNMLAPLVVLQTLSKNPKLSMAVVKDYVIRQISQQTRSINLDRLTIEKFEEETAAMQAEVQELRTSAKIFQLSKCTACTFALDLPAVHFLCMHSFHQRCLGDNDRECPVCAPSYRKALEAQRTVEQRAGDNNEFFQRLKSSNDGFSVIAEYFGRGILTKGKASKGGGKVPQSAPAASLATTAAAAEAAALTSDDLSAAASRDLSSLFV